AQDHPKYSDAIDSFFDSIHQLLTAFGENPEDLEKEETSTPQLDKPKLDLPISQSFSVYNIEIGDSKDKVEAAVGVPKRSTYNEYGLKWSTYHQNYQHFFMATYDDNNKVVGLYTNQDLITSTKGITLNTTKEMVRQKLGKPLSKIEKGTYYYQIEESRDHDIYLLDGNYVTIFYDKHENNTVTALQIISEKMEDRKQEFYTAESVQLREGFEYQLFDLTNATRVNHGLSILTWNDRVKETARDHSLDMAVNNYFDHQNLAGQSPFDRMQEDQVVFTSAGENLAYGQFSSIFAHEGLMNSLGHRENILRSEYEFLGVGVAFNDESQPYYTQNFFAD
ncbi:MAG: CAP domain-containing protein, partial [Bacillus sp. (in: firmicutes)]